MRAKKIILVLLLALVLSLVVLHINRTGDTPRQPDGETKFVLYYTPFWKQRDYHLGYGFEPFKKCKYYKNCYATANRTFTPLENFDALIFHASYLKKGVEMPRVRKPHQVYVFMNVEAPVNYCPDLRPYGSYFNWTMTYRFDSDIVRRHAYVVQGRTGYSEPSPAALKSKTKLAAWFVSNCDAESERGVLGAEIQKFIAVDVYGKCGNLTCDTQEKNSKLSSDDCYAMVERDYKFYFSFENSYCRDYATEKLYKMLAMDVVPVVYGGSDYKTIAPPNSVINVEDFDSVQDLTDYLKYLDSNVDEYLKYFEWKKDFSVVGSSSTSACQICRKLHQLRTPTVYADLQLWWWGENNSTCKLNKDLPPIVSKLLNK